MSPTRPDKLSLIVHSRDYGRIHYALVLASGAASQDIPVTVFFTNGALHALRHDDGNPGWHDLPSDNGRHTTGHEADEDLRARNLADFETLLGACVSLNVVFMVCELGLKSEGIERTQLRDDIPLATGGVVTFMNDADKNGSMLFI